MPISLKLHRTPASADDVLALFAGCHERIRRFGRLAVTLAEADAPPAERAQAATDVMRYFTVALPLHARDEDETLAPRLRGRDPQVDAALDRIAADHHTHDACLAPVLAACAAIAADPHRHAALAPALRTDALALCAAFDEHLALEEAVIFPALAALSPADRDAIRAEIAARRA